MTPPPPPFFGWEEAPREVCVDIGRAVIFFFGRGGSGGFFGGDYGIYLTSAEERLCSHSMFFVDLDKCIYVNFTKKI